jgi:uncharacterized LabA/DUF88 family protein
MTLLQEAWENLYDIAILVSSDKDFVPIVNYLHNKGVKCIQAGFKGSGFELAQASWATIDIELFCDEFRR